MAVFDNDLLVGVKAIRKALRADSILNTGVSDQFYYKMASSHYTLPYCMIDLNAGASLNVQLVNNSDLRFLVKVVGDFKDNYLNLAILAGRIYGALHEVDLSDTTEGWHIWRSQRMTIIDYLEFDAGIFYAHTGGIFRLRMSS